MCFALCLEAEKQQLINEAVGAAEAVVAAGKARAESIEMVSKALGQTNGSNAASLAVAEKYVTAFESLARTNNTLILPANTGDVSSMVAQVTKIRVLNQTLISSRLLSSLRIRNDETIERQHMRQRFKTHLGFKVCCSV